MMMSRQIYLPTTQKYLRLIESANFIGNLDIILKLKVCSIQFDKMCMLRGIFL